MSEGGNRIPQSYLDEMMRKYRVRFNRPEPTPDDVPADLKRFLENNL